MPNKYIICNGKPILKILPKKIGNSRSNQLLLAEEYKKPANQYIVCKIATEGIQQNEIDLFNLEINRAKILQHKNMLPIVYSFKTPCYYYIAYQKHDITLEDLLAKGNKLPELEARKLLLQIFEAYKNIRKHSMMLVMLSIEKIFLFKEKGGNLTVKLGDYFMMENGSENPITLANDRRNLFVAPELAYGNPKLCSYANDVWVLGSIYFRMITGKWPFPSSQILELENLLKVGDYSINARETPISSNGLMYLQGSLQHDYAKRYSLEQLTHLDYLNCDMDMGVQINDREIKLSTKSINNDL